MYGPDISPGSARYPDVNQITAVQVTPRPKPRAFPRTNPAYVGVHRRDGAPSYKRINIETSAPPTAIFNQRFYEAHASPPPLEGLGLPTHSSGMQTCISDLAERQLGYRHDRSDSDTSHSSYGRLPSDVMTDSFLSSSSHMKVRDASDSHSSQGSLRNLPDSHSSQGSLRSGHERDVVHDLSSTHSSPRHNNNDIRERGTTTTPSPVTTPSQRGITRRNSEPDYANLPAMAPSKGKGTLVVDDPITRQEQESISRSNTSEERVADGCRSADSLSPGEPQRQDTPSSIRSHSTQNSTSHTSEGRSA